MGALNFTKSDLKRLWILLISVVLIGIACAATIIKLGLLDKLVEVAQENIIFSMCIVVPIMVNSLTLFFYSMSMTLIPTVVDGVVINKLFALFPIYNGVKISNCYYESELQGILGTLPVITDIILFLFYTVGLVYLFIVDGFFIITPAISLWGAILFGLFLLNNTVKSVCMGKVAASFNDVVPMRYMSKYYLVPLIGAGIVAVYYGLTPIFLLFGINSTFMVKSTLMNVLTIFLPFFIPIYTCFSVRKVLQCAYSFQFTNTN